MAIENGNHGHNLYMFQSTLIPKIRGCDGPCHLVKRKLVVRSKEAAIIFGGMYMTNFCKFYRFLEKVAMKTW